MSTEIPVTDATRRNANAMNVPSSIDHIKHAGLGNEVRIALPVSWRFVRAVLLGLVMRRPVLLRVLIDDDDA